MCLRLVVRNKIVCHAIKPNGWCHLYERNELIDEDEPDSLSS